MFKIFRDNGEVAEVDSLDIAPEDLIVIKLRGAMPTKQIKDMADKVKEIAGSNKIIILPDGCEIGVLKQEKVMSVDSIVDNRKVLMEDAN